MLKSKILIVDDEKDISKLIAMTLENYGFDNIIFAYDGKEAIEKIENEKPDLILLDLMLPILDGLSVCRKTKENPSTSNIPIIMISAKNEENDIVIGLELGANDYITKPFSPKILIARIKNQLRINEKENEETNNFLKYKDLTINKITRTTKIKDEEIQLTYSEFEILSLFLSNIERVFTRNQLLLKIKGENGYDIGLRAIDVQILNLRRKLKDYGYLIESVRGVGYRFNEKTC